MSILPIALFQQNAAHETYRFRINAGEVYSAFIY
jgi:hypothetical protein